MRNFTSQCRRLFIFTLVTVASTAYCNATCTPPASGLVGWWRAEGNADDAVGGNNGTLVGGVGFGTGEVGQAFLFTDTNQDIVIPASSSLNVGLGDGFTLEAWVNPIDVSQVRQPIFEWNAGDGIDYWGVHFYIDPFASGSYLPGSLYTDIQGEGDVWHQMWSPAGVATSNVFQHVALTYDKASGVATIYYNGAVVAQENFGSFTPKTTQNLHIGRRPIDPGGSRFTFSGMIDEAAVYNRALSADEIAAIYNAGSAGKCAEPVAPSIITEPTNQTVAVGGNASFSVTANGSPLLAYQWYNGSGSIMEATNSKLAITNVQFSDAGTYFVVVSNPQGSTNSAIATLAVPTPVCTPPASGLVGWWRAEGNADDAIGGNNGTLVGGVGFGTGEVGQAFLFTDTNQDIVIPASSNLNVGLGDGFTLEAWVNPIDVSQVRQPIFEWNAGDGIDYWGVHFYIDPFASGNYLPGSLYTDIQGEGDVWHQMWSPAGVATSNVFQHVALTYDKASGVATIYYNGAVVAQQNFGSFTPKTTQNLHIGRRPIDPGGSRFTFSGMIDEAAVYNRALSADEIAAIYNAGSAGKCATVQDEINRLRAILASNVSNARPLSTLLSEAINSANHGNATAAINQLQAFQNQIRARIAPSNPDLANTLSNQAQDIIDALAAAVQKHKGEILPAGRRVHRNISRLQ